jgi:O-antigen ligase
VTPGKVAAPARAGAAACVALLGLAIPVSTAFDSVLAALVFAAWLVAAPVCFHETARAYMQVKPALFGLLVFAALLVSCTYSPLIWQAAWASASKYRDLALIPIFMWAATTHGARRAALLAFIAAIVLNLLVSYGTAYGAWESLPGLRTFAHYPIGFRLSVTHSFFVSLAAFALLLLARELWGSRPRTALLAGALALACIHNVLLIVTGRTGYVVLMALLLYLATTVGRGRRTAAVSVLVLTALVAFAYLGSTAFSTRIQDAAADLSNWKAGASDATSVGQRIGFYLTTARIVAEHPLTGVGAGGFEQAYAAEVSGTAAPVSSNAHNDYLMIAAQAGLLPLAALIALYVTLWRDAARFGSNLERDLARGLVLAMTIGGLFNSFLRDHAEGLFFAWATGVLYAGTRTASRSRVDAAPERAACA